MLSIEKRNDVAPICPHCDTELRIILFQELLGFLGRRYIHFCQHCKKVLGVSQRKGFWMG